MADTAQQAVAELMADTELFLNNHLVRLFGGGGNSSSGPAIFRIMRNPTDANNAAGGAIPRFDIKYAEQAVGAGPLRATAAGNDGYCGHYEEFYTYYIAMKDLADVQAGTAVTHFTLPHAGGYDIVLTSQLSACTFGIGTQTPGSGCTCSHIQGDPGTFKQRKTLRAATMGQMPQGATVYQKNTKWYDGNPHRYKSKAMVMGRREAGSWKFWGQRHDSPAGHYILSKVHRL